MSHNVKPAHAGLSFGTDGACYLITAWRTGLVESIKADALPCPRVHHEWGRAGIRETALIRNVATAGRRAIVAFGTQVIVILAAGNVAKFTHVTYAPLRLAELAEMAGVNRTCTLGTKSGRVDADPLSVVQNHRRVAAQGIVRLSDISIVRKLPCIGQVFQCNSVNVHLANDLIRNRNIQPSIADEIKIGKAAPLAATRNGKQEDK